MISKKTFFYLSLSLTLLVWIALVIIDIPLKSGYSPFGIVSFELCAYQNTCEQILNAWQDSAKMNAAFSVKLDYLFIFAYSSILISALILTRPANTPRLLRLSHLSVKAMLVAALADAFENYHLYQMLNHQGIEKHAWLAAYAATLKFIIIGISIIVVLIQATQKLFNVKRKRQL